MTHRTIDFGAGPIEVFDTRLAAQMWLKRHNPASCQVVVRGSRYIMRNHGGELEVVVTASAKSEHAAHILQAARNVVDECERQIEKMTEAPAHG